MSTVVAENFITPDGTGVVPVGTVIMYYGSAAPTGYLECNGQSTTGYADLEALIGPNTPDLRGEFVRGWDNGKGTDTGRTLGSAQEATEIRMAHDAFGGSDSEDTSLGTRLGQQYRQADSTRTYSANPSDGYVGKGLTYNSLGSGNYQDNVAKANLATSGVTSDENNWISHRPRNIALMYCIKH